MMRVMWGDKSWRRDAKENAEGQVPSHKALYTASEAEAGNLAIQKSFGTGH